MEQVAKNIGVQPFILERARKANQLERRPGTARMYLAMPEVVYRDFVTVAEAQQLEGAALLRGIVQVLLLSGKLPRHLDRTWIYRGRVVRMSGVRVGERWPWKLSFKISRGAYEALKALALANHTTATALVRGQVCDYMDGVSPKIVLLSADRMFNDPQRYLALWAS